MSARGHSSGRWSCWCPTWASWWLDWPGIPRVPVRAKVFAGIAAVYAFSPIDVVPDFIPVLGKTDDILLMALALRHVIEEVGVAVVREHWDGPDQVLTLMIDLIGAIADTIPRPLRMALNRFLRAG